MIQMLMIAPYAPPQNVAEAIQVRRVLAALDACMSGQLVTVEPLQVGWAKPDTTLELPLKRFTRTDLRLPCHQFTARALMSHRLAALHVPDAFWWLPLLTDHVQRKLHQRPDIIYSRSQPASAALLARRLKRALGVPWIMHLSDPWVDNPYRTPHPREAALEAACFADADRIAVTTESQAKFYIRKYPKRVSDIFVSPNVMADTSETAGWMEQRRDCAHDERLQLVFAGNFYGARTPEPLVQAIEQLRTQSPELLKRLRIDIFGQAQEAALAAIHRAPDVIHYHGPVSFREAYGAQHEADVILTIEPTLDHPLGPCFLPSKVMDCLALGKPMLALTPPASETARLCAEGYGWAVAPHDPVAIAQRLAQLIEETTGLRAATPKPAPARYRADEVAANLLMHAEQLQRKKAP